MKYDDNEKYNKLKSKLDKKLGKLFKVVDENQTLNSLTDEQQKYMTVMSEDQTSIILGKTKIAKEVLIKYVNKYMFEEHKEVYDQVINIEERFIDKRDVMSKVKVSIDRIKPYLDLFNIVDDNITIIAKTDMPIRLETDNFRVFIAPRTREV